MAGLIRMEVEEIRTFAQQYDNASNTIDDLLSTLRTTQGQISENWDGSAFEAFDAEFQELVPKVEQFSTLMVEIKAQLDKAAEMVQTLDQELSSGFGFQG